uniref:Apolipoprotein M n=1 Tax=Echeneis naucrates TaxID=173247 RepID=A0A665X967_ECHNA
VFQHCPLLRDSVSYSAPLACENMVQSLEKLDLLHLKGRWALVAGSLNDSADAAVLKESDSITLVFDNFTYTQVTRLGDTCKYYPLNISMEGGILTFKTGIYNFTGIFLQTTCTDCAVLKLDIKSPNLKSLDVYLFSRRRELEQKEMDDFRAQVACLNMPPPILMDPTKELCPDHSETQGVDAQET